MILLINICKEEMHYLEFVKPIEDILSKSEASFETKNFLDVKKSDLESCHRIIIAGTSLKDFEYTKHLSKFNFLKSFNKPVLAICGGMQILCMAHGCKLSNGQEIGLKRINFNAEYLGVNGQRDVYCLHNMVLKDDDALKRSFRIFSKTEYVQAVMHKHKPKQYGVLFHPEVRNKDLIVNFLYI